MYIYEELCIIFSKLSHQNNLIDILRKKVKNICNFQMSINGSKKKKKKNENHLKIISSIMNDDSISIK
jgi:hypothetical protein